jgi:hypothetical protein
MVDTINQHPKKQDSSDDSQEPKVESTVGSDKSSQGTGYYNGFDRPDSTRINLAGDGKGTNERIGNDEYDRLANKKMVGSVPPEKDFINEDSKFKWQEEEPVSQNEQNIYEQKNKDELPKDIYEKSEPPFDINSPIDVSSQSPHFAPISSVPKVEKPIPKKQKNMEPLDYKKLAIIFFGGLLAAGILGFASYYISGLYFDGKIKTQQEELEKIVSQINILSAIPDPLELPTTTTTTTTTKTPSVIPSTTTTTTTIKATTTTTTVPPTTTTTIGLG